MAGDPPCLSLFLATADDTARFGRWLASRLATGDAVLLDGPIGSGKTHFARALIQERLGSDEDVPSPTFTLVQTYGPEDDPLWHADLYRLSHPDEVLELGLDDAFATAICLVEWPDRLGSHMPETALLLRFSEEGDGRRICLSGHPRWAAMLSALVDAWNG
jgi:tRNA threonylcarbamoyladenosine biosynthesis protein TsaE